MFLPRENELSFIFESIEIFEANLIPTTKRMQACFCPPIFSMRSKMAKETIAFHLVLKIMFPCNRVLIDQRDFSGIFLRRMGRKKRRRHFNYLHSVNQKLKRTFFLRVKRIKVYWSTIIIVQNLSFESPI